MCRWRAFSQLGCIVNTGLMVQCAARGDLRQQRVQPPADDLIQIIVGGAVSDHHALSLCTSGRDRSDPNVTCGQPG